MGLVAALHYSRRLNMITGICIPCNSMLDTAVIVHAMIVGDDIVKVGKAEGQWYVVQQFNQMKKDMN